MRFFFFAKNARRDGSEDVADSDSEDAVREESDVGGKEAGGKEVGPGKKDQSEQRSLLLRSMLVRERLLGHENWLMKRSRQMRRHSAKILARNTDFWRKSLRTLIVNADMADETERVVKATEKVVDDVAAETERTAQENESDYQSVVQRIEENIEDDVERMVGEEEEAGGGSQVEFEPCLSSSPQNSGKIEMNTISAKKITTDPHIAPSRSLGKLLGNLGGNSTLALTSANNDNPIINIPHHQSLCASTTDNAADGSFYFGDLSTFQPCGSSSSRFDSPAVKANDGSYDQYHPHEFHVRPKGSLESKEVDARMQDHWDFMMGISAESQNLKNTADLKEDHLNSGDKEEEGHEDLNNSDSDSDDIRRPNYEQNYDLRKDGGDRSEMGSSWWWVNLRAPRNHVNVTIWARDCCTERFGGYVQILLSNTTNPIADRQKIDSWWRRQILDFGGKRRKKSGGSYWGTEEFYNDVLLLGGDHDADSSQAEEDAHLLSTSFLRQDGEIEVCGEMFLRDGEIKSAICKSKHGGFGGLADNIIIFAPAHHPNVRAGGRRGAHHENVKELYTPGLSELMLPEVLVSDVVEDD